MSEDKALAVAAGVVGAAAQMVMKRVNGMRWRWRRGLVVVLEVVIGLLAVATTFGDAVAFLMSYSSPLGTYTGQADDRNAAWGLLLLAVPSVFLFVALMFLRVRRSRRRRGMSRVKTGTSS